MTRAGEIADADPNTITYGGDSDTESEFMPENAFPERDSAPPGLGREASGGSGCAFRDPRAFSSTGVTPPALKEGG